MNKILLGGAVLFALAVGTIACSPEPLSISPTHAAFSLPTLVPPTLLPPTATARPLATATAVPSPTPSSLPPTATPVVSSPLARSATPTLSPSATAQPTATRAATSVPHTATAALAPAEMATAAPAVPPGLYVTEMRINPPPVRGQDLKFTVRFLNSMDHEESHIWLVYIFRADNQRGTGETSRTNSALTVGTTEFLSDGSWKLPVGGPCDYFYAQVGWINQENKVVWFNGPTGTVFQKGLAVCPP